MKKSIVSCLADGLVVLVIAIVIAVYAPDALAEDVFTKTMDKLGDLFRNLRTVVYVAGAFALVAVAVAGILGKVNWRTVAHLAAGLFVLVIAGEVLNYATSDTESTEINKYISGSGTGTGTGTGFDSES
jgi:hypothetical protein